MDATIVIDETVSRELTEHNMVAKRAVFNQQRKNTLPTTTLHNVHYACRWACPTSSAHISCIVKHMSNTLMLNGFLSASPV